MIWYVSMACLRGCANLCYSPVVFEITSYKNLGTDHDMQQKFNIMVCMLCAFGFVSALRATSGLRAVSTGRSTIAGQETCRVARASRHAHLTLVLLLTAPCMFFLPCRTQLMNAAGWSITTLVATCMGLNGAVVRHAGV